MGSTGKLLVGAVAMSLGLACSPADEAAPAAKADQAAPAAEVRETPTATMASEAAPPVKGMRIEPGLWELRQVATSDQKPEPAVVEGQHCLNAPAVTSTDFLLLLKGCELVGDEEATERGLAFDMACAGGRMQGKASFESSGSSLTGNMSMTMPMGGEVTHWERAWEGRHLGPCP